MQVWINAEYPLLLPELIELKIFWKILVKLHKNIKSV